MRNLADLTQEELKALFKVNKHLQEEAQERLLENVFYWIDEELYSFKSIRGFSYSISGYYDFIRVNNPDYYGNFFDACEEMQKDYCILEENTMQLVNRAKKKFVFFRDCYDGYEDISPARYKNLEKWMFEVVETVTDELLKYYQSDIYSCYDYDNMFNYFCENIDTFNYETDGTKVYTTICYA